MFTRYGSRRHYRMPGFVLAFMGFGLGVLLIGGGFFMGARGNDLDNLAISGDRVPGKVISTRTHRRTTHRRGRRHTYTDYYVTVMFTESNGQNVRQEVEVNSGVQSHYSGASAMNPVTTTVVVDPKDPTNWLLEDQLQSSRNSANTMMWLLPVIGLFLIGLGVFGTAMHFKQKKSMMSVAQSYPGYAQPGGPVPYPNQPGAAQYPPQPGQYPQQPGQNDNVIYDANRHGPQT